MQLKHYKYIFIGYSAILLLSLALFYLFPRYASMNSDASDLGGIVAEPHSTRQSIHQALLEGRLEQYDDIYTSERWRFDFKGSRLEITADNEWFDSMIAVERTAAGSGEIVAHEYRTESIIAHRINPYRVTMAGNQLKLANPEQSQIVFLAFNKDFIVKQFTGEPPGERSVLIDHFWTDRMLYLHIPAGVEIIYDRHRIPLLFIEEE